MRRLTHSMAVTVCGLLSVGTIWAQDSAAAKKTPDAAEQPQAGEKDSATPAEKLQAEQRLKFMIEGLKQNELFVGKDRTSAALLPHPALRWSNPVSDVKDGIVGVYVAPTGRPVAVVQFTFHSKAFQVNEFYSVTTESFEMRRGNRSLWKPAKAIFAWQELNDGPSPAKTPQLRLTQMRQIAGEFDVTDNFGAQQKEKQHLRLLAKPLLRYTDEAHDVIDGAVFAYTMGTDPEANLVLELVRSGESSKWQFAFSPMSIYALTASRKNQLVWEIGERQIFNSYDTPFRVGPYPQRPGENIPE